MKSKKDAQTKDRMENLDHESFSKGKGAGKPSDQVKGRQNITKDSDPTPNTLTNKSKRDSLAET